MRLWGGFVNGKLDWTLADLGWGGWGNDFIKMPAIFKSQREARKRYVDVRPVELRVRKAMRVAREEDK